MQKFLFLLLLMPFLSVAQDFDYKNFRWEDQPARQLLTANEVKESAVILLDKRSYEYIYDSLGELHLYETRHKKIRLQDENAIQQYNKIYISLHEVLEMVDVKARSISENGKINEVSAESFKKVQELDLVGNVLMFAVDGLEKGSEIEYFYTARKEVSYYSRSYLQTQLLVKNASLELISPINLVFKAKMYNDFGKFDEDLKNHKRYLRVNLLNVKALEQEKFAFYTSNLKRVEYKLAYNLANDNKEILTWEEAADRYFDIFVNSQQEADEEISKILKRLKISALSESEKIKTIEKYIKTEYLYRKEADWESSELLNVLSKKVGNNTGIIRLFTHFFELAGINYELAMTTDRSEQRFDKDFMSWSYLTQYLFYFPNADHYLAPTEFEYRYAMIPPLWSNNDALFIRTVYLGDHKTAVHQIRHIPASQSEQNTSNLQAEITLDIAQKTANVWLKQSFSGENAMFLFPYYESLSEKEKEKTLDELLKFVGEDVQIQEKQVNKFTKNDSPLDKHLEISAKISVKSLLEKAGNDYLLHIGNLIGKQNYLVAQERKLEIQLACPNQIRREISVFIPEGYVLKGLENLKIHREFGTQYRKVAGFRSDYHLQNNLLHLSIEEYYMESDYSIAEYEEFRSIINSAADFSNVVVILEKK
ncbi:MAG: DUF3857 domain-containing protein [Bacteroidetes bacterium]|nr:MAG: DUF3857 domain-containing protein [Bacteroidota bacterium]